MKRFLLSLSFAFAVSPVLAQEAAHTSTVTLSVGGQPYSYNYFDEHAGPAAGARYEFRVWKYFALEAGVDNLLPEAHRGIVLPVIPSGETIVTIGPGCTSCVIVPVSERSQVTLLPFGAKGILPLANGRLELFLGLGGAYSWHFDARFANALLAQGSLGGRFALDHKHHFWLGSSIRGYSTGYSNHGADKQTWLSWTADFGIRFGH